MCGIVGYVGRREAAPILIEGLRRLEYRGYDSAGVAVLKGDAIQLRRSPGKLAALDELLKRQPLHGTLGLGHTRWATHGCPSEENAHPHTDCHEKIVVVHNGIIENYMDLKARLTAAGHRFKSQTDTEVLAHLIEASYTGDLAAALGKALAQVQGSYALGVMAADQQGLLVAARKDSPLVLGIGEDEMFLASDVPALLPYTRQVLFLENGDRAVIERQGARVTDRENRPATRPAQTVLWDALMAEKGGYKHFMLKEIYEQETTIHDTFRSRVSFDAGRILLEDVLPPEAARRVPKLCLLGCGTSYHAALVGRFWLEEVAGVGAEVEIASEYRYRRSPKEPGTLIVAITQSGETADTLAAMREAKAKGFPTLALTNVIGSTATREADHSLLTHCGPEIGVASTKAFTGQLTALFLLALYLAQVKETLPETERRALLKGLSHLPLAVSKTLAHAREVEQTARHLFQKRDFLYLGRHLNYPIALEGALKLKEISYIHAEGFPAGEMKHGPIAMIDEEVPVVSIATRSFVRDKMLSNMQEVKARGGLAVAVCDEDDAETARQATHVLRMAPVLETLAPIVSVIPLQLLAYYVAVLRDCDVDQPRNLAKSVTVE